MRERGVEPLQEIPLDPKSSASTSSATLAGLDCNSSITIGLKKRSRCLSRMPLIIELLLLIHVCAMINDCCECVKDLSSVDGYYA